MNTLRKSLHVLAQQLVRRSANRTYAGLAGEISRNERKRNLPWLKLAALMGLVLLQYPVQARPLTIRHDMLQPKHRLANGLQALLPELWQGVILRPGELGLLAGDDSKELISGAADPRTALSTDSQDMSKPTKNHTATDLYDALKPLLPVAGFLIGWWLYGWKICHKANEKS